MNNDDDLVLDTKLMGELWWRYEELKAKADASTAKDADGYTACCDRAKARGYFEALVDAGVIVPLA